MWSSPVGLGAILVLTGVFVIDGLYQEVGGDRRMGYSKPNITVLASKRIVPTIYVYHGST